MPSTISLEQEIAAPPSRVFEIAADIAGAPKVQPAITRIEMLTDGPIGVGTRWIETRKSQSSSEATVELWITEFSPARSYSVACAAMGTAFDTRLDFDPHRGGTNLRMTMTITPKGLAGRLMTMLVKGMMRKALADDLACIKRAAENRSAS
jgi:Polyketide cyclase / dehydrase and lipid transport